MLPLAIVRPLLIGVAVLLLVVLVIWGAIRVFGNLAEERLTADERE